MTMKQNIPEPGQIQVRVRQFKPKVRTGCITCKIRRIKCDETKPNCVKCSSTGRKCDGYLVEQPKVSTPRGSNGKVVESANLGRPVPFMSSGFVGNAKERRCFHFFSQQAVTQLTGPGDADFWNRFVLQAANHDPAIRHATIALGSLYEKFAFGQANQGALQSGVTPDAFALQQYVQAIGSLLKPIAKQDYRAADSLVTCILFVCFELLSGHYGAALSHINSGSRIMCEILENESGAHHHLGAGRCSSANSYVPLDQLAKVLEQLDTQATMMLGRRPLILDDAAMYDEEYWYRTVIPESFKSIEEARKSFNVLWASGVRLLGDVPIPYLQKHGVDVDFRRKLEEKLDQWLQALTNLIKRPNKKLANSELQSAHLMQLQKISMSYYMEGNFDPTRMDKSGPELEKMLTLAESTIRPLAEQPTATCKSTFTLGSGVVVPLYVVGSQSRDPILRRKAIELLRISKRQEGMWNSGMVARVLERLVAIEERGIDEKGYVPAWSRVAEVDVHLDPEGRKTSVKYMSREKPEDEEMTVFQEWLD